MIALVRHKPTAYGRATLGLSRSGVPRNSIRSNSRESPVGQEKERMKDFESLAHVRWECKYHVIFIPKYRRKVIYGKLRASAGRILRDLCKQKGIGLLEGHVMSDHVHLCLSIPPK